MFLVRLCTTPFAEARILVLVLMLVLRLQETTAHDEYVNVDGPDDTDSDEDLYKFAEAGDFPHVVFLTSKAGWCTGVVLTDEWVLTAANCLYDNREKPLKDQAVTVRAGISDFDVEGTNGEQVRSSAQIKIHPRFELHNVAKYNVALVKVREKFEFGHFVNKIDVSAHGWPQNKLQEQDCTAFGFGSFYTTSVPSTQLKYWNVTVGHGENACPCLKRFQWKRILCVKELQHPRLCKTDCGGPVVCDDVVVGLGHMVWDRHACADPIYPQYNCRGDPNNDPDLKNGVSSFYYLCPVNDWIRKYIPEVPKTPKSCRASTPLQPYFLFIVTAFIITYCTYINC